MWHYARWAKLVALIGFVLPWMTVSCASQKILSASGWAIASGRYAVHNPMTGVTETHVSHPSLWIAIALVLTIAGLIVAFRPAYRALPVPLVVLSGGAVLAILIGTSNVSSATVMRDGDQATQGIDAAAMSMIRIDWEPGYWLTLAALVAAAILGVAVARERS